MAPKRKAAAVEQWWAVVDGDGALVSVGTVLADPLPDGLAAVKVDGPGDGRPWDPQAQAWGDAPAPPEPPAPDPVAAAFAAIGAIAAQDGPSLDEKLAAIVGVLAQNAPPTDQETA
jgi:hypothetical protein